MKLYIFNIESRAAVYGIGTYVKELVSCLKERNMDLTVITICAGNREVEVLYEEECRQIYIPKIKHVNWGTEDVARRYSRSVAYILREFITPDEPCIFHLNYMGDTCLADCLKEFFNCRIVLTVHYTNWSFDLLGDYGMLKSLLSKPVSEMNTPKERKVIKNVADDKKMIARCDNVICIARHSYDAICELYPEEKNKFSLISNGLLDVCTKNTAEEKKRIRRKYHVSGREKIIFFAGRLDEVKGLTFLFKAFKKLLKKHDDVRLVIAGDGNFFTYFSDMNGFWTKVSFTGRLDKSQLFSFYKMADVGVITSLHEEFGFVAVEMMMHALPVIVADTTGLSELVVDGVSGLKVPVRKTKGRLGLDVNLLSAKIEYVLENPLSARKLGANGRKRFLEKYERSVFAGHMIEFYERLGID